MTLILEEGIEEKSMTNTTNTIFDFKGIIDPLPDTPKDWDELRKLSRKRIIEKKYRDLVKKHDGQSCSAGNSPDSGGAGTPPLGEP